MNIVYQITSKDGVAYARNIADCDALCRKMIDRGILPSVRRMKRTAVPMRDIGILTQLKWN